jgi:hypothetical protein
VTGQQPPELDQVQAPAGGETLMGVFLELDRCRGSSGFGPLPIGYADIAAWIHIHNTPLSNWEIDTLCEMDAAALRVMGESARRTTGGKG